MNKRFSSEDYILVVSIILLPFGFFTYLLYPELPFLPLHISGLKLVFLNSLSTDLWYFANRFLALSLVSLWFISCNYKWVNALLVLGIHEIFRLACFIGDLALLSGFIDGDIAKVYVPMTIIGSLIYVYLMHYLKQSFGYAQQPKKGIYSIISKEVLDVLNYKSKFSVNKSRAFKKAYKELQIKKAQMSKDDYLKQLIKLRDSYEFIDV